MKSYLKWAGRKDTLLEAINEKFKGSCHRWVEPFAGSLSVFLDRYERTSGTAKWHLNDQNESLVNAHRTIQEDLEGLLAELNRLPWNTEDWKPHYGTIREEFNEQKSENPSWKAARFIWLNRACFNGLYRTNKSGKFNVPVGSYLRLTPPVPALVEVEKALKKTTLTSLDFEVFLREILAETMDEHTHVYADPPYVPINLTSSFTAYTKEGFSGEDQVRLATILSSFADRGAQVVASNHDVPAVRELYGDLGFAIHAIDVKRSIAANGAKRKKVGEVLLVKALS